MGNKYASYKHLLFTDSERPTSYKMNQILNMVEDTRLAGGPYSISLHSQSSEEFVVKLNEDLTRIGGAKEVASIWYTNRLFNIYYETRESATESYGCWENVQFAQQDGYWLATLTSGNNIHDNELDVSSIDTSALYCLRCSGGA